MTAHPQDAARAVAVAQHGFGGDKPGETAVELLRLRPFHAYSAASGAVVSGAAANGATDGLGSRSIPEAATAWRSRSISCSGNLTSGGRTTAGGRRPSIASTSFIRLCMSRNGGA